jgi:hypothetical protein
MEQSRKKATVVFLAGVLLATIVVLAYHRFVYSVCTDVIKDIHFLVREGDADSARAILERDTPYFSGGKRVGLMQLIRLKGDLRLAVVKHVIDGTKSENNASNQASEAIGTGAPQPQR